MRVSQCVQKEALEDLKQICGALSQLKNEMQTNKTLTDLPDDGTGDEALWNACLQCDRLVEEAEGAESAWFVSPWLLVECYFYRRIHSAIRLRFSVLLLTLMFVFINFQFADIETVDTSFEILEV